MRTALLIAVCLLAAGCGDGKGAAPSSGATAKFSIDPNGGNVTAGIASCFKVSNFDSAATWSLQGNVSTSFVSSQPTSEFCFKPTIVGQTYLLVATSQGQQVSVAGSVVK